jgi:hypothetical protein
VVLDVAGTVSHMTVPPPFSPGLIFVGTYRLPPGTADAWRAAQAELSTFLESALPELIAFDAYLDADGTRGTSIHVHRDEAAFDRYLATAASRIRGGAAIVEVIRIDLYGEVAAETLARLRAMGPWPVEVHAHVNGIGRDGSG